VRTGGERRVIRLSVDAEHPAPRVIAAAADVICRGGLVAFPTETVYGLGADALSEAAVRRIFAAKGRPAYNPIIAHVGSVDHAHTLVVRWSELADRLAAAFWPGPLTLVLPRAPHVPLSLTAGRHTVAVRMPSHPVALALIHAAERPIAAPSANRFTALSPTTADHVERGLGDHVAMILDGGATHVGIESTVVDLSGDEPVLLRPGTLSRMEIERTLGVPLGEPSPVGHAEEARRSPGMIERHYAPRARVVLVDSSAVRIAIKIERATHRVGALIINADASGAASVVQLAADPRGYAQALYASLHTLDEDNCTVIVVERPPQASEWAGVNDRLRRASHQPSGGAS